MVERAKKLIRFYIKQQENAKTKWKKGEISKEKFLEINKKYIYRIDGIQALFRF